MRRRLHYRSHFNYGMYHIFSPGSASHQKDKLKGNNDGAMDEDCLYLFSHDVAMIITGGSHRVYLGYNSDNYGFRRVGWLSHSACPIVATHKGSRRGIHHGDTEAVQEALHGSAVDSVAS